MNARRLTTIIPSVSAFVVAIASFTLSFVALRDVAAQVDAVPDSLAWLVPIVVDGGILAGSASLWASSYRQVKRDKVAYVVVAVLLAFSVVVNASHAGPTPLAKAIAALPPIVLLATLELVAATHRRQLLDAKEDTTHTSSAPADVPHTVTTSRAHGAAAAVPEVSAAHRADTEQSVIADAPKAVHAAANKKTRSPARPAAKTHTASRADAIRAEFDELVLAGVDPSDPKMASTIAERLDVTPAYVRRLIRPLREETLDRSSALPAPVSAD